MPTPIPDGNIPAAVQPVPTKRRPRKVSNIQNLYGLSTAMVERFVGPEFKTRFIAGAELEIESVIDFEGLWMDEQGIVVEHDGSLRNKGREFLLPPSTSKDLVYLFTELHGKVDFKKQDEKFSERTSTHIHVNCLHSTYEQVRALLLLYAIFEPLAFNYVGPTRRNNIHCTPLNSTLMPNYYGKNLQVIVEKWGKYSALNLLPLRELGTVEFRHLEGTDDPYRFETWLKFIETLWTTAHAMGKFKVDHLTDLTMLRKLESQLLTYSFVANCVERPRFVLEDNLLDVKLGFV